MWIQSVVNAISEVNMKHPGLASKVAGFNPDGDWSGDQWNDYNKVAGAIVEPFIFPGGESEDEEFYYERTERDGFGMVKGNIDGIENYQDWKKICDLVDEMGY